MSAVGGNDRACVGNAPDRSSADRSYHREDALTRPRSTREISDDRSQHAKLACVTNGVAPEDAVHMLATAPDGNGAKVPAPDLGTNERSAQADDARQLGGGERRRVAKQKIFQRSLTSRLGHLHLPGDGPPVRDSGGQAGAEEVANDQPLLVPGVPQAHTMSPLVREDSGRLSASRQL
jgi:hypothetical protein